jgi:hypothetical protein
VSRENWDGSVETEILKLQLVGNNIYDSDRIALADLVIDALEE